MNLLAMTVMAEDTGSCVAEYLCKFITLLPDVPVHYSQTVDFPFFETFQQLCWLCSLLSIVSISGIASRIITYLSAFGTTAKTIKVHSALQLILCVFLLIHTYRKCLHHQFVRWTWIVVQLVHNNDISVYVVAWLRVCTFRTLFAVYWSHCVQLLNTMTNPCWSVFADWQWQCSVRMCAPYGLRNIVE